MTDHDQRFKELLREFALEFLALFMPRLRAQMSTTEVRWQPQEVFTNPPLGLVRRVDLLAMLDVRQPNGTTAEEALHLEFESAKSLTEVRKKIGHYYPVLRIKHSVPVNTFAFYLNVGLRGLDWDRYTEYDQKVKPPREVYSVSWRYAGLPAMSARDYLVSGNWLGVALSALMRIEKRHKPWLRAEILRRVALECQENDYRKLLLINCAETYLPMEGDDQLEFQRLLKTVPRYREAQNVIQTTYDRLINTGELKALRAMLIRLAARGCGQPDEATRTRILAIEEVARLEALVEAAPTATSWDRLLNPVG